MVVSFKGLRQEHYRYVGRKAANLAAMINAELPVPPGFCVTVTAFKGFLDSCPRRREFLRLVSQLSAAQPDQVAELSQQLTDCLADLPVTAQVEEAVLKAWRDHGEERTYAVRSSATVEDAADHSFAGQFESILSVRGKDALLAAIKKCWLSLYSARALAYQAKAGLPVEKAAMAVVVQAMVPANTAGVLFTRDPVSGNASRMVIEGTPGLGDQLVSGKVNPECVVFEKATLRVVRRQKTTEEPCLDDALVGQLGKLAGRVERLFGEAQDIEWAAAGASIFLLQARPVTATRPIRSWEDRQVWSNLNAGEVAPDVMTPVSWSIITLFLGHITGSVLRMVGADISRAPFVGLVAGRVYFNVNTGLAAMRPFPRALLRRPNLPEALGGAQIGLGGAGLLQIPELPDEDLPDLGFRWPKYLLSWPRILWDLVAHSPVRGDAWTARLKEANDARRQEDFAAMPVQELLRCLGQVLEKGFRGWDLLYLVTQAAALLVFRKACHDWLRDPELTFGYRLFAGLGGIPETEAGLALWRLAALAHADSETESALRSEDNWASARVTLDRTEHGREFLAGWDAFISQHGHHCRGELELFNPRWSETPDYILGIVRGYLHTIDQTNPLENQRRLAQEREQLTAQCRQRLKNPIKRWIFSRALRRAQKLAFNREEWKNQAVRHLTVLRRILLALGERLAREGVLARADHVFFLHLTEIEPVATGQAQFDVKAVIQKRRTEYERNLTLTPPPVVVGRFDPGAQVLPEADIDSKVLKGIPVFPGVVAGPARVILRTDDHEQVLPGEILVAPFTDPAWSPYFVAAAGVVMDRGGILSHGSIVAREYGLPAVTNVGLATRIIRTGDPVQVDGNRGQVTVLGRASSGDRPR